MSGVLNSCPYRVLIIDDDIDVRNVLQDTLEDDGYGVLPSANVLDPDDVVQLRPDVMLLDLVLFGETIGWDYLHILRSRSSTAHLPVIVCTGDYDTARAVTAAQLSLATAMILKPFELEELLGTVAAVLPNDQDRVAGDVRETLMSVTSPNHEHKQGDRL